MTQNPKSKGGQWERDFCRLLSLWWSKGEDRDIFWRTASSGGMATINKNLPTQVGDVTYMKPEGQLLIDNFVFELKHYSYKGLDFLPLLDYKGNIFEWWVKLCKEAEQYNKIPFLVIKVSHRGVYGILPKQYLTNKTITWGRILKLNRFSFEPHKKGGFSMFCLDEFLSIFSDKPEEVILHNKEKL